MKKTYITTMPNHIGAFLRASECFASLGVNITRVSYNKAVDSHTLFIDAEGEPRQLEKADRELEKIGYLGSEKSGNSVQIRQSSKNSAAMRFFKIRGSFRPAPGRVRGTGFFKLAEHII